MRHNQLGGQFFWLFFLFHMEHVSPFWESTPAVCYLNIPYITHTWYVNGDTNFSTALPPRGPTFSSWLLRPTWTRKHKKWLEWLQVLLSLNKAVGFLGRWPVESHFEQRRKIIPWLLRSLIRDKIPLRLLFVFYGISMGRLHLRHRKDPYPLTRISWNAAGRDY